MNDQIIGTAVLFPINDKQWMLKVCCKPANDPAFSIAIPVSEEHTNCPQDWKIQKHQNELHVHPSLLVYKDRGNEVRFHNTYSWTIKFVEATKETYWDLFDELNRDYISISD